MKILKNYDLKNLNTFGISVRAKFFVEIQNKEEFRELFDNPIFKNNRRFFLGGGSNILLTGDFNGIVILNKINGIEILEEDPKSVLIKSMSGEVWHDLVTFVVNKDYWGIENLALIPGSVGAAPIQNIGAYGAELKDVLESVEAYDLSTGEKKTFHGGECAFGYRDSIFKNSLKDKYFISAITLRLGKKEKKNISYKVLKEYLEKNNIKIKSSKDISQAVSEIRRSKLPDPKVIGNAGSFFKNVFVDKEKFKELLEAYSDMPYFEEGEKIKISAAWLIEQSGWKGKRVGDAGVHEKQALVLVNYGKASGQDIKALADKIVASVNARFGLKIEPEVNLI